MSKGCLWCGKISDNDLYVCSICLNQINEVRRDVDLKMRYKKNTLLGSNRIGLIVGLLFTFIPLTFAFVILKKIKLPLDVFLVVFYPALVGFSISMLLGILFSWIFSKLGIGLYRDKDFYLLKPGEKLKHKKQLKAVLKALLSAFLLIILSWIICNILLYLLAFVSKIELMKPLWPLRHILINVFSNTGFFLGLFVSLISYSDWVKGLEK